MIYNRLKERNKLDLFTKFRIPRDYRISEHPREIGGESATEKTKVTKEEGEALESRKREACSDLTRQIRDGKFVFTGELEPVKTTNLDEVIEGAKILKGHVVAINITDNPTAFGYLNDQGVPFGRGAEYGFKMVHDHFPPASSIIRFTWS